MLIRGLVALFLFVACKAKRDAPEDSVAGNAAVAKYMNNFAGRGALVDGSPLLPAQRALELFTVSPDLQLHLVLSEPDVRQPVNINFDGRGRLWVVQYNQYPYPKGLKIVEIDEHLRSRFDKQPLPPPSGNKGADKITFFEDTNGDGKFDRSVDAIKGLNIATSVAFGRGKIWVLNPPYLLAYGDKNDDGLPDGDPEVHLRGFGIEDTHAVANSLTFAPDGWLYGAQGSTVHSTISSAVTTNVRFKGQALWRYHPHTRVFEVFAEGGGNTFHIEIDSKGRLYSGDNGTDRGQYYKQGAYYVKNLGKHGLHSNAFAFGHLANMELRGEKSRFTHAFIRYESGHLPARFDSQMVAINPLQNYVQFSSFEPNGSTFRNVDEEKIVQTSDKWFRPVDIKTGPDGRIYMADWSDSRLSHIDPRDNWHKASGRIYALGTKNRSPESIAFNMRTENDTPLLRFLSHRNRWFRQQALQELYNRKDPHLLPALFQYFAGASGQEALEYLWGIHASGGFSDSFAISSMKHEDPYVRMWSVRLCGDSRKVSSRTSTALQELSRVERHPEVQSQLAATAIRIPAVAALPLIKNLCQKNVVNDPDIPLQIWWALEAKYTEDPEEVLRIFHHADTWKSEVIKRVILERLMRRCYDSGDEQDLATCTRLLKLCPQAAEAKGLISGLEKSIEGTSTINLRTEMRNQLVRFKTACPDEVLGIMLRAGDSDALTTTLQIIDDPKQAPSKRKKLIRIAGEIASEKTASHFLSMLRKPGNEMVAVELIKALSHMNDDRVGREIINLYSTKWRQSPLLKEAAVDVLVSRKNFAHLLLDAVTNGLIRKNEISAEMIARIKLYRDNRLTARAHQIWSDEGQNSREKSRQINRLAQVVNSPGGDVENGKKIYTSTCAPCHKLFDRGGNMGPDLTGYDRKNINELLTNIVDPDAFIREGYVNHTVWTTDGRTINGLLKSSTEVSVVIQPLNGDQVTIPAKQVDRLVAEPTSLMPEGLLNNLAPQQVRDLFSYLTKKN